MNSNPNRRDVITWYGTATCLWCDEYMNTYMQDENCTIVASPLLTLGGADQDTRLPWVLV